MAGMVDMLTPDGRRVSVPAELAGRFAGLSPPPAAPPDIGAPLDPDFGPADAAGLAAVTPPPAPPTDAPVTMPTQVPQAATGEPRAPVGPPTMPAEVPPEPANTPAPEPGAAPPTQRELGGMGEAGVLKVQDAAVDKQAEAAKKIGEAQVAAANAAGDVLHEANVRADQQLAEQRAAAETNAKALQDATNAYLQSAKQIADTKIDRSIDHPVVMALATALNVIGTAMAKGDMSKVMDPVYRAIDAKAAAQIEDLKVKQAGLATRRDALGLQRQAGDDFVTMLSTYRMAGLEQAQRKLEEYRVKSTSALATANIDKAVADLEAKKGDQLAAQHQLLVQRQEAAANRASTERLARAQNAVTMRGQDLVAREADLNRDERAKEALDKIAEQLLTAKGANATANAKRVVDLGLYDPSTGKLMLDPMGQKKIADADAMEAQAREDPTPVALAYVKTLRDRGGADADPKRLDALEAQIKADPTIARQAADEYAATLRQSAETENFATTNTPKNRDKVQEQIGEYQTVAAAISTAQRMLEAGPAAYDREAWAAARTALANVKARYIATLGERVSVKALEAFDPVLSVDADSVYSRTADKGKALSALKALQSAVSEDADITLKNAGVRNGWTPGHGATEPISFGGKTSQEVGADAQPGAITSAFTYLAYPFGGAADRIAAKSDEAQADANARRGAPDKAEIEAARKDGRAPVGRTSDYGLDPAVDDRVRAEIKRSGSAGHEAYRNIVQTLARPLTATDRPGLDTGVARLIRDQNPKLLDDVLKAVAASEGEQRAKDIAAAIAPAAGLPSVPRLVRP